MAFAQFSLHKNAASDTRVEIVSVVLTQGRQVGVLGAEQEEIYSDLLTRAVQSQFLVKICGRAEVLNSLKMKEIHSHYTRSHFLPGIVTNWFLEGDRSKNEHVMQGCVAFQISDGST